jgi:hypothetical protein
MIWSTRIARLLGVVETAGAAITNDAPIRRWMIAAAAVPAEQSKRASEEALFL